MTITTNFTHHQTAHCESGAVANLISHHGVKMSEAMAFGIGAGLFFGYLPFLRLNNLPLITYRSIAGSIIKRVTKALDIEVVSATYRNQAKAMVELDQLLDQGIPVGLQTGAFWLPYFPKAYRFHFNMHNLVVVGREGNEYVISDPVFPELVRCDRHSLMKARFAKGTMSPKGKMYYFKDVPPCDDFAPLILKGIESVSNAMLKTPIPILGVRGIRFLANRMEKWPRKFGLQRANLHLGQVVRMQEEIGTGGAGFRFIYAAFLQEAANHCHHDELLALSARMTEVGDHWRHFAVLAARNCKGRAEADEGYPAIADKLRQCAQLEESIYLDFRSLYS
ncbi:MAG: BtrH N-terminal domain-containing protein [Desulfobulbaceae bacterium]|nr:BtrH N-terminal domain-containing protein [Desulfobulbaceae bacterium]